MSDETTVEPTPLVSIPPVEGEMEMQAGVAETRAWLEGLSEQLGRLETLLLDVQDRQGRVEAVLGSLVALVKDVPRKVGRAGKQSKDGPSIGELTAQLGGRGI